MSKPKKSGQQKAAESIEYQAGQQKTDQQNRANSTLGQFQGPIDQSPFYKSLLNTGVESTSRAYDTARANSRARANMAGYGYSQPAEQGNEDAMAVQESSALAAVPRQAMQVAAPYTFNAGTEADRMALGYGGEELTALGMADNMQNRRAQSGKDFGAAMTPFLSALFAA